MADESEKLERTLVFTNASGAAPPIKVFFTEVTQGPGGDVNIELVSHDICSLKDLAEIEADPDFSTPLDAGPGAQRMKKGILSNLGSPLVQVMAELAHRGGLATWRDCILKRSALPR